MGPCALQHQSVLAQLLVLTNFLHILHFACFEESEWNPPPKTLGWVGLQQGPAMRCVAAELDTRLAVQGNISYATAITTKS